MKQRSRSAASCSPCIAPEVDRRLSIGREVEADVDANLKRAQGLWQAILAKAFGRANEAVPSPA